MTYPFVQARHYRKGGNLPINRIVIHDAEFPEKVTGAEDIALYFNRTNVTASAHAAADCDSVVECVHDTDTAYHAPPNRYSLGLELMGFAKQTTADWLDDYGIKMLRDQAAPWVRAKAHKHGVPLVWLSVADLKAGKRGITSHNNVSLAWGQSTHTDPGPNFPVQQFMAWVIGPPPIPEPEPEPEDDVLIVFSDKTGADASQVLALDGRLYVIDQGDTAAAIAAAGYKTVPIGATDYAQMKQHAES